MRLPAPFLIPGAHPGRFLIAVGGQFFGTARLTDIGDYRRVPFEVLEPTFARLAATGYVVRDGDEMWLTPAGVQQVDYVYSLLLGWIADKLARSPGFGGRPDRRVVEAALERVAYRVLVQRDWGDDTPTAAISPAAVAADLERERTISP